ncbi:ABC transporter ATP-binding protein [Bacteroidia bacterium]|nr:ABC transporter ATP-binding protein [Bacteroidia bacterium]
MSVYLQVSSLTKSFGDRLLFADVSFGIDEGQRIGLIAKNGTGKTTLLNIIAGKENADSGEVIFRRDLCIGYLEQNPQFQPGRTVLQTCSNSENEEDRLKAKQILSKLKITDFDQAVGELSGGQRKRVALATVLLSEPDLLILDEPTNHLDLETVEWLEDSLSRSRVSLLMVTHDRYFLDRVCNEIIELDNRQIYQYKGKYSYFLEKQQARIESQSKEMESLGNLFRKELEWMRRQPQARATKAKARIDAFSNLEKKLQQGKKDGGLKINVNASYIGNKIFEAKQVSKSFGDLKIIENFSYIFARYEKLGIVGNNGTGKTTFIRMLKGEVEPDSGFFDVGETVNFGYYSQEGLSFDENMKVIDVVQNIAEVIDLGNEKKLTASQFLQHFLFSPDKQHDFVYKLSGGEKCRLHLCTVLIKNPNFLILDEPTNDLDIITLNILEEYLTAFKGCVIVISHDRYFMDKVVDHLLVFKGQAHIKDFPGNYTQYRESAKNEEIKTKTEETKSKNESRNVLSMTRTAPKLTFNEKRELEALEKEIPELEIEKSALEKELSDGTLSHEVLLSKSQRIGNIIDEINTKTGRWMELSEKAEK